MNETNCSISNAGIDLINITTQKIKEEIPNIDMIYTSPYKRCIETSMCIESHFSQQPPIQITKLLRETLFTPHQLNNIGTPLIQYINIQEYDTWDTVKENGKIFLEQLQLSTNNNIMAVTHGGVINSILSYIDNTYKFDYYNTDPNTYVPKYCDYIILEYDKIWKLVYKSF